jgi:hypothetical protein
MSPRERLPTDRPSTEPARITRGLYPSGTLAHTLQSKVGQSMSTPMGSAQGSMARQGPELPTNGSPSLTLARPQPELSLGLAPDAPTVGQPAELP